MALARGLTSLSGWYLAGGAVSTSRVVANAFKAHAQYSEAVYARSDLLGASCSPCSSSLSTWCKPDDHPLRYVGGAWHEHAFRYFSSRDTGPAQTAGADAAGSTSETGTADQATEGAAAVSIDDLKAVIEEKDKQLTELQEKVQTTNDKLLRSLAEMENLRQRTSRELDNTQKYAVQKFAKSLLEVADTLERAYESVPEAVRKGEAVDLDLDKATKLLKGVVEGVHLTSNVMLKVLQHYGLEQYNPINEKFDPNLHNALFEVPDPTKEAGTIAVVTKRGYRMHERVIRPAEVGVVQATS